MRMPPLVRLEPKVVWTKIVDVSGTFGCGPLPLCNEYGFLKHLHDILLAACLVAPLLAGAQPDRKDMVRLLPDTPVFAGPGMDAEILTVTDQDLEFEVLERRTVCLERNPMLVGDHPLSAKTEFFRIRLPAGAWGWASRDVGYWSEKDLLVLRVLPRADRLLLSLGFAVCLLLSGWQAGRNGVFGRVFGSAGLAPAGESGCILVLLLLAYFAGLFWVLGMSGSLVARPTDEWSYFRIASDILRGARPAGWDFNISVAFLYMPLAALCRATSYLHIMTPMVLLNSCLLTPGSLILVYLIVERLFASSRAAAWTVLLLLVLPLVYYPVELHSLTPGKPGIFKAMFGLPMFHALSYRLYYLFVWTGYNGLGDTASTFLVLLTILLALSLRTGFRYHALVSTLFGFACLLRINNVFFAPLIAYLFWRRSRDALVTWRGLCSRIGFSVGAFLLAFSPQFVANRLQFGNVLTFPYVLHTNRAAEGFNLASLPESTRFLIGTNWLYMSTAAAALFFVPSGERRRVLVLWIVPLLVFFCGYTVTGASPMRFTLTLYGALLASVTGLLAASFRAGERIRERLVVGAMLSINALLVVPCDRFRNPLPFFVEDFPWGPSAVGVVAVLVPLLSAFAIRRFVAEPWLRRFGWLWLGVFHLGSAYVVLACFLWHLSRTLHEWLRDAAETYRLPFDRWNANSTEEHT